MARILLRSKDNKILVVHLMKHKTGDIAITVFSESGKLGVVGYAQSIFGMSNGNWNIVEGKEFFELPYELPKKQKAQLSTLIEVRQAT